MFIFLCDGGVSNFAANVFPVLKFILLVIILLCSIALVVVVMMQESEADSTTNSITGVKESYYAQNRGMNRDGRLKKITKILAIIIGVSVILYWLLFVGYQGELWS